MKNELVRDWMTREVITISTHTTMTEAAAILRGHDIRRLPVVDDDGVLAGILSQTDVMSARPSDAGDRPGSRVQRYAAGWPGTDSRPV